MYVPNAFRVEDQPTLVAFMRAHSFIALVSTVDGVPFASHIPVVIQESGDTIVITGHLAKANPHWQAFGHGDSLAIFTGPHAYISPTLYEKVENVPTWNYIAVHAYGVPEIATFADHPERLDAIVAALIAENEASYAQQWADDDTKVSRRDATRHCRIRDARHASGRQIQAQPKPQRYGPDGSSERAAPGPRANDCSRRCGHARNAGGWQHRRLNP